MVHELWPASPVIWTGIWWGARATAQSSRVRGPRGPHGPLWINRKSEWMWNCKLHGREGWVCSETCFGQDCLGTRERGWAREVGLGLPQQAHPLDRGRRSRCSLRQHHLMIQTLRSSSVTWREPGAEGGCSSWSEEIGWAWRGKTEGLEVCSIVVCLEGRSPHRGPRQWGRRLWGVSIGPRWSEKGKLEANQHWRKSQHLLIERLRVSGAGCEGESNTCAQGAEENCLAACTLGTVCVKSCGTAETRDQIFSATRGEGKLPVTWGVQLSSLRHQPALPVG